MTSVGDACANVEGIERMGVSARFRNDLRACLSNRADELFESNHAVLRTDGPVKTPPALALAPEHQSGHGAGYDTLNRGRIDATRLRRTPAGLPLPRAADGQLAPGADITPRLRPDTSTSADRSLCHTHGRGRDEHRTIPRSGCRPSAPSPRSPTSPTTCAPPESHWRCARPATRRASPSGPGLVSRS